MILSEEFKSGFHFLVNNFLIFNIKVSTEWADKFLMLMIDKQWGSTVRAGHSSTLVSSYY